MHLTDKQIKQIMELADNYALDFSSSFLSTKLKASSRAKIEKKLINISMRSWNEKHKLVYEHQWLMKDEDVFFITDFYKTKKEASINYGCTAKVLCRLKQTKREVK